MPIAIVWRHETLGRQTEQRIPFLNAELLLTKVGDVIVDASWQLPHQRNVYDESNSDKQLVAYFMDPVRNFLEVKLLEQGSAYSQKIWRALLDIPVGEVASYSALAEKMGSGPRAVAQACKNNPYAGIIPCHRVVSKNGIGGFMGHGEGEVVELKSRLLAYERSICESAK